jgi:flagellar hook protein FlgE
MGIFDALTTAVSGLQAQSFALQNISGNIANSQTVGYKETDTAFDALVSQAALGEQTAGGVFASSVASNGVQGTIQNETTPTDMAINGDGYFVVTTSNGVSGTTPTFSGVTDYTRRGDFQMDSSGYLVNGAGYYLEGIPLDPATGAATTTTPTALQFGNSFLPAQATTNMTYAANLPSAPTTGVLDPTNYTSGDNPLDAASGGNGVVVGQDVGTFNNDSLDGGSVTAYDTLGNPVNVQLRWAETASSGGNTSWQLFYQTSNATSGTTPAWQNAGTTFTFNSSGVLTSPTTGNVTLSNLTVAGDNVGNVTLNYGSNLTQFASSSGSVDVNNFTQNGFAAGSLQSLSVANGQIVGSFSNGQTVALANVPLATFNGQDSLQSLQGEAFAATPESGNPNFGGTGQVVGSSLESSNVDIATQFSQLIVAQQAYSANARVMTTADQMIQSLLTVIQ